MDFSGVFLMIRLGWWVRRGRPQGRNVLIRSCQSTYHQRDLTVNVHVDQVTDLVLRVPHCKVILSHFFHTVFSGSHWLCSLCSSGGRESTLIIWNYSAWHICLFSPITYAIIDLSVFTHGYLFCTLGYNPLAQYMLCCLNCSSFDHWEVIQVGSMSLLSPCVCVIPQPGISHFSREPCNWRMVFETRSWQ